MKGGQERRECGGARAVSGRERARRRVAGAPVVVVDDGIATGTPVRAAMKARRRRQPARLVLAVPVAPADTVAALSQEADEVVCLAQPEPFHAIGLHYADFHQVPDEEVLAVLDSLARPPPAAAPPS